MWNYICDDFICRGTAVFMYISYRNDAPVSVVAPQLIKNAENMKSSGPFGYFAYCLLFLWI